MEKHEFKIYQGSPAEDHRPTIGLSDLHDDTPRTLVYGSHINDEGSKDTFHVYLGEDGLIHKVIYDYTDRVIVHQKGAEFFAEDLVPSKRAYPAHTDHHFAVLMRTVNCPLTFTSWEDKTSVYTFSGLVVAE